MSKGRYVNPYKPLKPDAKDKRRYFLSQAAFCVLSNIFCNGLQLSYDHASSSHVVSVQDVPTVMV